MNENMTRPKDQQHQAPVRADTQRAAVRPRVDVFENEAEYLLVADVPGVAKDAVDIRFENGELRLTAQRAGGPPGQALADEYRPADYRRVFAMPEGVDPEKIDAELAHGVLKVRLPKSSAKRARRIDIRPS